MDLSKLKSALKFNQIIATFGDIFSKNFIPKLSTIMELDWSRFNRGGCPECEDFLMIHLECCLCVILIQ